LLPEDRGPCFGEIVRWRYNSEISSCVTFIYTGCDHNANYFTSEEACERACGLFRNQDVCSMRVNKGSCNLGITKWYFNKNLGECHVFMYSGCGGNGNRFSSKAECQHLCSLETKISEDEDICKFERDSGPCIDAVTQWYFDKEDEQCKQFTYGGCRGNQNRFNSKDSCEKKCAQKRKNRTLIDAQNSVLKSTGSAFFIRFFCFIFH
uniref:Tissue factor pathway inhibitor n=1 Tax=Dracunculus medinensis TaxID=318479 RepID=A0A0N4US52_DRAME